MRLKLLLFLIVAVVLGGCKDNEPQKNTQIESVVWKYPTNYYGLVSANHIYKDYLIQGFEYNDGFKVVALDLENGELIWENTDFPNGRSPWDIQSSEIYNNWIVLSSGSKILVIDLNNGESTWSAVLNDGKDPISIINGWVYKADRINRTTSTLYRYNIVNGEREKLFTLSKNEHGDGVFGPQIKAPVLWNNQKGEEVLVMHNKAFDGTTSRMDVLGFNLTADTMLWYKKGLDTKSSSSRPAIDENKVYFYGLWHAYCLDANTGEEIWRYYVDVSPGGDFNTANILVVDDKLIVKQENRMMTAVNKYTGEKIWHNPNTRASPGLLTTDGQMIWFSSGGVIGVDAHTGEKLVDWKLSTGAFIFPVAIHPTKNLIYTSNGNYIYCLNPEGMK